MADTADGFDADAVITLTRALTPDQRARRARLVDAACDLAMEGGYAAVTMHDVADRAGVARATVYRYFTSKNHLLGAVSAAWIGRITDEIAAEPLPDTPAARLSALLCRIVDVSADNRLLAEAIVQAVTAPDPSRGSSHETFHNSVRRITTPAFDATGENEADRVRRDEIETVLGHVLLSGLVSLTARGRSREEVRDVMRTAVRLMVPDGS